MVVGKYSAAPKQPSAAARNLEAVVTIQAELDVGHSIVALHRLTFDNLTPAAQRPCSTVVAAEAAGKPLAEEKLRQRVLMSW